MQRFTVSRHYLVGEGEAVEDETYDEDLVGTIAEALDALRAPVAVPDGRVLADIELFVEVQRQGPTVIARFEGSEIVMEEAATWARLVHVPSQPGLSESL